MNIKFMQSCATIDTFSLGVIILQIIIGFPAQLQLPLKTKCRAIDGRNFINSPPFGFSNTQIDMRHVKFVVRLQNRFLSNIDSFITRNDCYRLLERDPDLKKLLLRMISKDYFMRPHLKEINQDKFIKKYIRKQV